MAKQTKTKSKRELEAELQVLKVSRNADIVTTLGKEAIRWFGISFCVYWIYRIFESLAGETTIASVVVDVLGKVEVTTTITLSAGGFGVLYGLWQRKLRKDTVQRLQSRNTALELKLDPTRTSSLLTARGDSRPEDVR
jgi:hypothetical protein